MTRDLALGVLLLALAGAYYTLAIGIPESQLADAVGPQGLPKAYAGLLGLLALVLIGRALQSGWAGRVPLNSAENEGAGSAPSTLPHTLGRVAGMLAIGALYIVVVPWAGYIVSLAGVIVGTTYYQGGVINRHVLLIGVSGALLLWLVFVLLLGIPQPAGIWPSPW